MSSALYRKYRPQTFSEMIGQNHIKITLQHEIESGNIAHAYLFCGPRGLGKTTSARLFAKSINCLNRKEGESEPCNTCRSCMDIMAGQSVDIIEIDAASNTGVDNVRENIIESSRFNPIRDKFKVFIIDEVHMLSTSAFNALLKIMEEPPAHVIFILCTTEVHKLPVTIISRCQRFDLKKVTGQELLKRLELVAKGEGKKIEEEVFKRIILASDGCVRDAESLLSKVLSLGDEITLAQAEIVLPRSDFEKIAIFVGYLSEKNSTAAIEEINKLVTDGFDLNIFAENLLEFLRQILLIKINGNLDIYGMELSEDISNSIASLSQKFNWGELIDMIEVFSERSKEIKQAQIPQFPLEIAVVRIINKIECQKPEIFNLSVKDSQGSYKANNQAPLKVNVSPEKSTNNVNDSSIKIENDKKADVIVEVENKEEKVLKIDNSELISLDFVVANWEEVLRKLSVNNFSLFSLLKMGQPVGVDGNRLEIALANNFFKERMEAQNNRLIIEEAFKEQLGKEIAIKGIVSDNVCPIEINVEFNEEERDEVKKNDSVNIDNQNINNTNTAPNAIKTSLNPVEEIMSMF